jgi:putative ABC transport system substrate-binding protein
MQRREFIAVLVGAAAIWPLLARAQQKPVSIGFLGAGARATSATIVDALMQGLRDNGLAEGKGYVLEERWAEGAYERFPAFARELVERKVDVIVVSTIAAARAAQRETSSIPIVMGMINDPVGNGLVASLARPGGNTTGMASLSEDVSTKLVELLQAIAPKAATIVVLFNPANPSNLSMLESLRARLGRIGIAVRSIEASIAANLKTAFDSADAPKADAMLVVPDFAITNMGEAIAAVGLAHRIPVITTTDELTRAGALISYGISRTEIYRRSAYFVKKVLEGVKPADLPVEQPTRFFLLVNLKTARTIGITVPETILATADEVVE